MHTPAVSFYFTWPDRRFRYECRGCGNCCKGYGIGLDVAAGQLVQLVKKRPEIAAFARRRGDAMTIFNPRNRCWFFEDDGLCRIEVEDGRAAKPASCRLFPFNRVYRAGEHMIVDYNSVLCPLEVVADGGITHAEIIAEIETTKDKALAGTVAADADLDTERAITSAIFATPTLDAAWSAQAGGDRGALEQAFEALTGQPWRAPGAATLETALLFTPSARFNELFGPRQYAPREQMAMPLAGMWLAWLGFAALGETLAQRPLAMPELTTMWGEQAAAMYAIARWSDVRKNRELRDRLKGDPAARMVAIKDADLKHL
jgi:Fe-S-cluster containining protein